MRVYELRYPGAWLDGMTPAQAHEVESQLLLLGDHLADAAVGLALFEGATISGPRAPDREERHRREAEVREAEEELARCPPPPGGPGAGAEGPRAGEGGG